MNALLRRRPVIWFGVVVVLPLLLAGIVLLWRPWIPVLDMAMTELRIRDVGTRFTPLVGLPGRIGDFPDQGSHPGPWSFYLIAPFYRIAGSTAWGMEFGSIVVNSCVAAGIVALGFRRFGMRGAAVFALLAAIAIRGYGLTVLTHPWNPYFPVLIWLLVLLAAWLAVMGDHWMALVVVIGGTIAAQTHVPYLVEAVAVNALVLGVVGYRWIVARRAGADHDGRPLLAMLGIGALLWVPPLIEQIRDDPGNVTKLLKHFTTDETEATIGLGRAGELVLQHLDLFSLTWDLATRDAAFVHRAGIEAGVSVGGLVILLLWVASVGYAWQRRHPALLSLHAVNAVTLLAGWIAISRIFGKVWFYLTLWMSGTALLVGLAIGWTAWLVTAEGISLDSLRRRFVPIVAGAVAVVTVLSVVAAVRHEVPEREFSDDVRALLPDVTAALDEGAGPAPGPDARYVVFWQEAVVPGSEGYALLSELERRGYDVGVHPTWRVPATPHRVFEHGEYDAEVHIVSGAWLDDWRTRPGYLEVANHDDRTEAERARFDELDARVEARLVEIGREDLIEVVDLNIFGASLDPGLPDDIVDDLAEMLLLGVPVSVFVAPANSTF